MTRRKPDYKEADVYWSQLTDDDLRNRTFRVSNPEAVERLVLDPPPDGSLMPRVIHDYDVKDRPSGKVRCAHCNSFNHWRGFVCEDEDGNRFLVGHQCGEHIYGINFQANVNAFEEARQRADDLREVELLFPRLPGILVQLQQALLAVREADKIRRDFKSVLPGEAAKRLRAISDRGLPLSYTERIRDRAAEERRDKDAPDYDEKGRLIKRPKIFKETEIVIGQLSDAAFLMNADGVELRQLRSIAAELSTMSTKLPDPAGRRTWLKRYHALREEVNVVLEQVRLAVAFFMDDNMNRLAYWAEKNDFGPGRLTFKGSELILWHGSSRKVVSVPHLSVPAVEF